MRKNFTQLIHGITQSKKFVIALTSLMLLAGSMYLMAAVGVTVTGGGTFPISADLAANATLSTPGFTSVGTITIVENAANDISSTGSILLRAPSGWRFGGTSITATAGPTPTETRGGAKIAIDAPTISLDGTVITIPVTNHSIDRFERIIISGVQVQALNGSNLPASGSIRIEVADGALVSGLPATLSQSISQIPGAVRQLAFITQPTDVLLNNAISPAIQVQARDQFGNIEQNPSVTLALGNNTTGATLSAGSASTSAGIVTFPNVSINRVGVGYTLVASSPASPNPITVTSAPFTVNNNKPTISEVSNCLSAGDPATAVTITGSNFVSGASVLVNGQARAATVTSATSLTTTLSAAELETAGDLSIVVKNPAPAQDNGESNTFTKQVIALQAAGSITGTAAVCPGDGNVLFSVPANSAITSYQWSLSSGAATLAAPSSGNTVRLNFGNTAGDVQLTVVGYNACNKPGIASTYPITIKPTPVVSASVQANRTAICEGETVTLTATGADSYIWSANGITVGNNSTVDVTPSSTTTYTVVGTTANCPSTPQSVTINVTPKLTQDNIAGVASYCHNAAATPLTATVTGGGSAEKTFIWEQSGTGADGSWTQAATSETYTPSTSTVGTTYYRRTVTAGQCSLTTAAFSVEIKPNPVVNLIADDVEICEGTTVQLTASGADSYVWTAPGETINSTADKINVQPATTTTYTVVGWTNGCPAAPKTMTINVTPALSQGAITGIMQYCQTAGATGSPLTASVTGGSGSRTFRWEQRAEGSTSWGPAAGTNNAESYSPSIATAGVMHYRRIVESGNCIITGEPVAVTVTPAITTNTITTDNQRVCSNETINPLTGTVAGGITGQVSYQWEQSSTGTDSWTNAPGATSTSINYSPSAEAVTTSKTTYYRRKVESGNCTTYSNVVSVRIVAMPQAVIAEGANTYFCPTIAPGTAPLTATLAGADSYAWYKVGEVEPFASTRSVTVAEAGDYYVEVTVEGCTSKSLTTNVRETIVNTNVLDNASEIEVCYGGVPEVLTGSSAVGRFNSVTYQWYSKTTASGNFQLIQGATGKDLELGVHTQDRWYQRVASEGGCAIPSNVIWVKVKPELRVTNIPANNAVCNGGTFTFNPIGSVEGSTFSWTRATAGENAAKTGGGGISDVLVNNTTAPITVTYSYTTSGNENCTGAPQTLAVVVNPTPQLSSSLTPAAICGGNTFNYLATSATTGTTFSWVRQPATGISASSPGAGNNAVVNETLTNTTADPIDVTYTFTLTANGCSNTQDVVVRVNPRPQLSSTKTPAAICSGATFTYTPTSATEGASYTWTRLAATNITSTGGASGAGNIAQELTNTGTAPVTVTYRITTSANGCSGTEEDVVVTVNPSPVLSSALTGTVCSGATFNYTPTSATQGATYSWSRAASSDNPASSGSGNISEVLTNTTTAPITVIYEITSSANNCNGTPQNLVVTVNPLPLLSSALTASVCSGSDYNYIPSSATANVSYTWTRAAVAGISNAAVTNGTGSISETLVNTTASPVEVTYVYTLTANNCARASQNVVVTVNPRPQLSSTLTPAAICSGATFSYNPSSETSPVSYEWTRIAPGSITSNGPASGNGSVNQTLTNSSTAPVTVTYRYTTKYTGVGSECAGSTQDVQVVVNPSPIVSSQLTASVCSDGTFSYAPTSATNGATFTWTRAAVSGISNAAVTTPVNGSISEKLVNTTASAINVTYRIQSSANGCTGPIQDLVVTVNPNLPVSFTGVLATNDVYYTAQGTVALSASLPGGTFSGPGVNGTTFSPCTAGPGTHTITYTRTTGTCTSTVSKTISVQGSTYTAVNVATPYPICKGQNTEYKAFVYRDVIVVAVTDTRHPDYGQWLNEQNADRKNSPERYWQPFVGVLPLDANGKLQPAPASLIMNTADLDPATHPNNYQFQYDWHRNTNRIGSGRVTAKQAGLSATDAFWVRVTPKEGVLPCSGGVQAMVSNNLWLSTPANYNIVLSAQNPICKGDGVRLVATPNVGYNFANANLEIFFYIKKAGAPAEEEPTRLNATPITVADPKTDPNAPTTYSFDVPPGVIENGDVVSIFFSTDAVKCLTSGDAGSFMTMQVNERPAITLQPTVQTACAGTTATFTVGATGAGLTYQWLKRPANNPNAAGTPVTNGGRVSGATTASLSITNAEAGDEGLYYVVVGGACPPSVLSDNAELIVNPVTQIATQPVGNTVCAGATHTFTVSATGVGLNYQWFKDGNAIPNQTGASYTVNSASQADAGNYSVRVTGTCGEVLSSVVPFVVNEPPVLVNATPNQEVCAGKPAAFNVTATGTSLTYEWRKGNTLIEGATNSSYSISAATSADAGSYSVTISGACAPPVTHTMQLVVNALPTVTVNSPTVCAGEVATVIAEAQGGSGDYEYIWDVPEGRPNPGNVTSFTTSDPGQYTVRVKDAKSCEATLEAIAIVTMTPRISAQKGDILAENETGPITTANPIAVGDKVTFSVVSDIIDAGPASYAWFVIDSETGDWIPQPGENSATFVVDPVGEAALNVQCIITPGAGNCYLVQTLEYGLIIPLPVELLYFNAKKQGTDVVLEWATASELDNKGFEVQVSSDARNFRVLGFVESKVNTTSLKQVYSFVDKENGKHGVRYYRLKQIDLDGKFEIFNVRAVHFGEVTSSKVKAYPNPFQSEVELSIEAEVAGEMQIMVTNATGQQLLRRTVQVSQGQNMEKITLDPTLPRGVYIVTIRMGELNSHFKLLKQ